MNKGKVIIGMTQFKACEKKEKNLRKAEEQIRALAEMGAKIICTQELFAGKYFPQTIDYKAYDWAEPIDGPINTMISSLAKALDVVIVSSYYEYVRMAYIFILQQFSMQMVSPLETTENTIYRKDRSI